MHWEDRFRAMADDQEGLIAKFHLPRLECDSSHWKRARRNGRWRAWSPRVISLDGAPETDGQRALAAVFDASPGAVLHGPSALAWLGLRGYALTHIEVARSRFVSGAPTHLARLHRLRDLRPHDVIVVRGVPTETALRAIWSEAAKYSAEPLFEFGVRKIGRILDQAHRRGLVTWAGLHEIVGDIRERGRSGTRIMRYLAEKRPPGSSPTESRNEDRLEELLATSSVSPLRRQRVLGGHEPIGRCDFRDTDLPLAVEVNSLLYHSAPSDRHADELRYRRLNEVGFTVAVVWEDDLWSRPSAAVATIEAGRHHAANGECVVIHSPSCPWPSVLGTDLGS